MQGIAHSLERKRSNMGFQDPRDIHMTREPTNTRWYREVQSGSSGPRTCFYNSQTGPDYLLNIAGIPHLPDGSLYEGLNLVQHPSLDWSGPALEADIEFMPIEYLPVDFPNGYLQAYSSTVSDGGPSMPTATNSIPLYQGQGENQPESNYSSYPPSSSPDECRPP